MSSNLHYSIITHLNFKKIPNHALTHYISDIYPTKTNAPKTAAKKSARRPLDARKILTKPESLINIESVQIPSQKTSSIKPIKSHKKPFNRINKTEIAEFFNNLDKQQLSREEWQMTIDNMFKEIDRCKAEIADAERELLIDFVESVRTPKAKVNTQKPTKKEFNSYGSLLPFDDEKCYGAPAHYADEDVFYLIPFDYEAEMAELSLAHAKAASNDQMDDDTFVGINSIDATEEDKFERLFFENEINGHVLDVFEKKMHKAR